MNVHVLQHVPFEGIGSMETWLAQRQARITCTRFFESSDLPALTASGLDLIIAMGGPMSVIDEAALPWLVKEKQFLREAIHLGIPVLGICLGAQLIASALGAKVYPAQQKEIGWFDVEAVPASSPAPGSAGAAPFAFPSQIKVFHWHGETFDLPPGAVHLARSRACQHQAFQIGSHVIGLQFHMETTPDTARLLIENFSHELKQDNNTPEGEYEYVQTGQQLQAAPLSHYERIHEFMDAVLTYLTRRSSGP